MAATALAGFISVGQFSPASAQEETLYPPAKAIDPSPPVGASGVSVKTPLQWKNGGGAFFYDVYIGTTETLTASDLAGITDETVYNPANLLPQHVYYWRVDARNLDGLTPGDVWSFQTGDAPPPSKAVDPNPFDESSDVPLDADLYWRNGGGAERYEVYFGTSATLSFMDHRGSVEESTYDPGSLSPGQKYFWRIDSVAESGYTFGDVWTFQTSCNIPPAQVTNPSPVDGQTEVAHDVTLRWQDGGRGRNYRVYLGTSSQTLTMLCDIYYETSYSPYNLASNQRYYWRVDAVNEAGVAPGPLWQFTTAMIQAPGAAKNPSPSNGSVDQPIDATLKWENGGGAQYYSVYFGENPTPSYREYRGITYETAYNPGLLARGKTYYWKVESTNGGGRTVGDVWSFSTLPVEKTITITSPTLTTVWPAGSSRNVRWESTGAVGDNVSITLYDANGLVVSVLAAAAPNNGLFVWDIPVDLAPGTSYKIAIISEDRLVSDVSEDFTITVPDPKITVIDPTGESAWEAGKSHQVIRWASQGAVEGKLCVDLYKGGVYQETIAKSTPNNGVCVWHISNSVASGSDYQIKVSEAEGDAPVSGISEMFAIVGSN